MKKILFVFAALFAWAGMQQVSAQKSVDVRYSQARLIEPIHSVHTKPLIADLVVDSKLGKQSHTFHFTMKEINALQGNLENVRARALFKAVNEVYHCDVIVAASFDVQSTDDGYDVTIIGFPASYTNWRTATKEDYEWIRNEKMGITGDKKAETAISK